MAFFLTCQVCVRVSGREFGDTHDICLSIHETVWLSLDLGSQASLDKCRVFWSLTQWVGGLGRGQVLQCGSSPVFCFPEKEQSDERVSLPTSPS